MTSIHGSWDSFGVVCYCGSYLIIFVFGTAKVRATVFIFGFANLFASATTLLLAPSINSSVAHFVSSSTRSILPRIEFNTCCMSCSALLLASYDRLISVIRFLWQMK